MNQHEQDILKKIEEKTEDIQVPESLKPEQILDMLKHQGEQKKEEKHKKKMRTIYRLAAAAAACLVAVFGFHLYLGRYTGSEGSSGQTAAHNGSETSEVTISEDKQIASAADYEDAYRYLDAYADRQSRMYDSSVDYEVTEDSAVAKSTASVETETAVMENELYDTAGAADSGAGSSYSETNVRQNGVDEADIVKTDGKYLYVLKDNSNEIAIVNAEVSDMRMVQTIVPENVDAVCEFYLDADKKRLMVICEVYPDDGEIASARYWGNQNTTAITYDISDKETPKELGRVTQNGSYQSSRKVGEYLYLFSNYSVYLDGILKSNPETYIPLVNDKMLDAEDIYLPSVSEAYTYSVVTSIDISEPDKTYDSKAILSDGGQLYVSNENIYYYDTVWNYINGEKTTLRRIAYKDGRLESGAQGKVDGYINDSFSIDEYNGYLRIVLTDDNKNDVRILNMDLEEVGAIENLAKDESVYSARLMGDTGYFVTFEQVDPLFSVDLSDPENPEIIGTLKIPGFSEYLHPYGDGRLLGIGMDADEETGITDGVKVTMFDISDPSDVKEEDTYILKNVYSTEVSYDYKAALVDADKNLIGFSGYTEGMQEYFLFSYDEDNGFTCHLEEEINGSSMMDSRGIYIDDTLYVVQGNVIEAYSLKDYQKVGDVIL